MQLGLRGEDDFLHSADDDQNFNESRYYNFYDEGSGVGGWVRMGNRPNEHYAELTVCVYLPDGSVGFIFKRPHIDGHSAHDAGGLRFEVEDPFRTHRVTYSGDVCLLGRPRDMIEPKAAFTDNPHVPCTIDLRLSALCQPFGGEPVNDDDIVDSVEYVQGFARGHTEQFMASTGAVQVGEERFDVRSGHGWRDHSWGPRIWQSIPWYRSVDASFGTLWIKFTVRGEEGVLTPHVNGFVVDPDRYGDDRWVQVQDVTLHPSYDDEAFPIHCVVVVTTDDDTYELDGDMLTGIPLRHRRQGEMTRITSSLTRWRCRGLQGGGVSEYLDQIIDGVPIGLSAGF